MVLVDTPLTFYVLRFMLGAAEAGFFPGLILYLTHWFPARERARAVALFMTATAMAGVIGAPISSAILQLDGAGGLHGWQWLFLIEGLPAVLLAPVVLRRLTEKPADATWLTADERRPPDFPRGRVERPALGALRSLHSASSSPFTA